MEIVDGGTFMFVLYSIIFYTKSAETHSSQLQTFFLSTVIRVSYMIITVKLWNGQTVKSVYDHNIHV